MYQLLQFQSVCILSVICIYVLHTILTIQSQFFVEPR